VTQFQAIQNTLTTIQANLTNLTANVTNLQTNVTNLQTGVTNLQTGHTNLQNTLNTLQVDLQQAITALYSISFFKLRYVTSIKLPSKQARLHCFRDARNYARSLNSRIFSEHDTIVVVPDLQNRYPLNFPANINQLRALTGLYNY
jgi:hypothetical protein